MVVNNDFDKVTLTIGVDKDIIKKFEEAFDLFCTKENISKAERMDTLRTVFQACGNDKSLALANFLKSLAYKFSTGSECTAGSIYNAILFVFIALEILDKEYKDKLEVDSYLESLTEETPND